MKRWLKALLDLPISVQFCIVLVCVVVNVFCGPPLSVRVAIDLALVLWAFSDWIMAVIGDEQHHGRRRKKTGHC